MYNQYTKNTGIANASKKTLARVFTLFGWLFIPAALLMVFICETPRFDIEMVMVDSGEVLIDWLKR